MRLSNTPKDWNPRDPIRFRSFHFMGYPIFTAGFGLAALGVATFAGIGVQRRLFSDHSSMDWGMVGVFAVALIVALPCLYFAIKRVLVGYDIALEIDRQGAALLVLERSQEPKVLPFTSIESVEVKRRDTRYTSGRHVLSVSVTALPTKQSLYGTKGESMFSRPEAVRMALLVGKQIADAAGVELIDETEGPT